MGPQIWSLPVLPWSDQPHPLYLILMTHLKCHAFNLFSLTLKEEGALDLLCLRRQSDLLDKGYWLL